MCNCLGCRCRPHFKCKENSIHIFWFLEICATTESIGSPRNYTRLNQLPQYLLLTRLKIQEKPQINLVTNKVNKAIYVLRFIEICLAQESRKTLVRSLVIPHPDYCSEVYLDVSAELIRSRLQRLSNSCIRYIYEVGMCERITPFRISLGWLRTDTRRLYFAAILMYKILCLNKPKYLAVFFPKVPIEGSLEG